MNSEQNESLQQKIDNMSTEKYAELKWYFGMCHRYEAMRNHMSMPLPEDFEPSNDKAFQMFKDAAEFGNKDGLYEIGLMHLEQDSGYFSPEKGISILSSLATPAAYYQLGMCYRHGNGVPVDYEAAFEYFKKASRFGNAEASFQLGGLCLDRNTGYFNVEEGIRYLKSAAERDVHEANVTLAQVLLTQKHTPEELKQIVAYIHRGIELGDTGAEELLDELKKMFRDAENQKDEEVIQKAVVWGLVAGAAAVIAYFAGWWVIFGIGLLAVVVFFWFAISTAREKQKRQEEEWGRKGE